MYQGWDQHPGERICEGGKVYAGRLSPWGAALPAGRAAGADTAAGGAWTLLRRGVHVLAC